jgi:predicted dehydrogenase
VVGTGFGCRVHVPALRAAGFEVVALVGRDPERTARRASRLGIEHACTDLDAALAVPGADSVTIATPPDTHAPLVIAACAAGRHVICEKPFALDAGQAREMLDAAQRAGVTHLVGHEFRWSPDRAVAARALRDGLIGDPRTFTLVQYVPLVADPSARNVPHWWFDPARGGGWLGASGSHAVDQLRTWLGEIASVSSALPAVSARDEDAEDTFVVRAALRTGAHGVLQQTGASWVPGGLGLSVVAGTDGTLELCDGSVFVSDRAGRRALEVPADLRAAPAPAVADDPRERFTHLELGPYTRLCEVFRAGIEGCDLPAAVPPPTFADGVAVTRVLDAVRASAAAAGAVIDIEE